MKLFKRDKGIYVSKENYVKMKTMHALFKGQAEINLHTHGVYKGAESIMCLVEDREPEFIPMGEELAHRCSGCRK